MYFRTANKAETFCLKEVLEKCSYSMKFSLEYCVNYSWNILCVYVFSVLNHKLYRIIALKKIPGHTLLHGGLLMSFI